MIVVKFGEDTIDSFMHVLNSLIGFRIEGEWTNKGFPADCSILLAKDEGLLICEVDEDGEAIRNSWFTVGYDEIVSITIV
jgi:hypothetical protein